jgi:hypothetical protein
MAFITGDVDRSHDGITAGGTAGSHPLQQTSAATDMADCRFDGAHRRNCLNTGENLPDLGVARLIPASTLALTGHRFDLCPLDGLYEGSFSGG